MFSGKSEELLRRVRRATIAGRKVRVFKSHLDDRYGGIQQLASHDGRQIEAVPVGHSREIVERVPLHSDVGVVAVDEVQFLDDGIVRVASALADQGRRVVLAGTDMDFRGRPFGAMGQLMAIAEEVVKLHAICVQCGEPATRNQRLLDGEPAPADGPTIRVGGLESYEARCRTCHEVPSSRDEQMPLLSSEEGESDRAAG